MDSSHLQLSRTVCGPFNELGRDAVSAILWVYEAAEHNSPDVRLRRNVCVADDISSCLSYEQVFFGEMIWPSQALDYILQRGGKRAPSSFPGFTNQLDQQIEVLGTICSDDISDIVHTSLRLPFAIIGAHHLPATV